MSHTLAIENSPLQTYASALLFSPAHSLIRCLFRNEELEWITIRPSIPAEWNTCLQTLEGHSGSVNSVAFSHDSARLASASGDNTVKIWNTSSGACLQTLKGHSNCDYSIAFSHDSARLASASGDNTVKIWNASSSACLQTLDIGKTLYNISFDTTGSSLQTEIGTITISASSASAMSAIVTNSQHPQNVGGGLSSEGAWITYNSENVLWLPSEYRPSRSSVSGKNIGIGVGSGKVWMCSFNIENNLHSGQRFIN